jgi:hypothetical protein
VHTNTLYLQLNGKPIRGKKGESKNHYLKVYGSQYISLNTVVGYLTFYNYPFHLGLWGFIDGFLGQRGSPHPEYV